MRQGQQNRRGRGRGNNNNNNPRKGQNPLTRSFESNGPDVKLRGTPAHIAEKYMSLARDAQSAGDPVLAENYLQHAEHYNRIIMAYREQQAGQPGGDPGFGGFGHQPARAEGGFAGDADVSDEGDDFGGGEPMMVRQGGGDQPRSHDQGQSRFEERAPRMQGEHQPRHGHHNPRDRSFQEGRGGYGERRERPERHEPRHDRGERQDRFDRSDRSEPRMERERFERAPERDRPERDRPEREPRGERFAPPAPGAEPRQEGLPPRRRERPAPPADRISAEAHEQPEFLRRPVRRPRRDEPEEVAVAAPEPAAAGSDEGSKD